MFVRERTLLYTIAVVLFLIILTWYTDAHKSIQYGLSLSSPRLFSNQHATGLLGNELYPIPEDTTMPPAKYLAHNQISLRDLFECMARHNCRENQTRVVILESYHFRMPFFNMVRGEEVWGQSFYAALESMGLTLIIASSMDVALHYYNHFPNNVAAVVTNVDHAFACFYDQVPEFFQLGGCHKNLQKNPYGIPAWMIHPFSFWEWENYLVGKKWVMTPEPYYLWSDNPTTYIGYSIERSCRAKPTIPVEQRKHRAFLLGRTMRYLSKNELRWPVEWLEEAARGIGLQLTVGASTDEEDMEGEVAQHVEGLHNIGKQNQLGFEQAVRESKVMIGLGAPWISPSPWQALCLGVPFINPIKSWDADNRTDRSRWDTQHNAMRDLDPPYVYHVFVDDRDGFLDAVAQAIANPIDSFVPERMTTSSLRARVADWLDYDWKHEAELVLARRLAGEEEGELFDI